MLDVMRDWLAFAITVAPLVLSLGRWIIGLRKSGKATAKRKDDSRS
jgi:hypothetical protein